MECTIARPTALGSGFLFLVLLVATVFSPAAVFADDHPSSPLDPALYLRLEWKGHPLHQPGWEVIGRRGTLNIDFDREEMKQRWRFDSQGALSIRGYVVTEDGKRPFEIPGYSVIGKDLQVRQLDLSVGFKLVAQLIQGSRLAHRINEFNEEAEMAGLRAEAAALAALLAAEDEVIETTERELERIYLQALRFRLTDQDVLHSAANLAAARSRRSNVQSAAAAGVEAELTSFFQSIATQRATLDAWLEILLAEENAPYLSVLGQIADRDPDLIVANAKEIQELFDKTLEKEDLTQAGRQAVKRRLVKVATILIEIENDIFTRYKRSSSTMRRELQNAPQLDGSLPAGFGFDDIVFIDDAIAQEAAKVTNDDCPAMQVPAPGGPDQKEVDRRTQERVDGIRALIMDLTGSDRFKTVEANLRAEFRRQVESWLQARHRLAVQLAAKEGQVDGKRVEFCALTKAREELNERLKVQSEFIKLVLMTDVTHGLIDGIVPTVVSLDGLDLQRGDRLELVASLLPGSAGSPPPPQFTASYLVTDWGWGGPKPAVKDTLTFVRPKDGGGNYAPRPGAAAVWNWSGTSPKRNSFLRTLSPGFGIEVTFLNADDDDETIEVGLGVTMTLFNDLLHLTYGQNLQQRYELDDGDEARDYYGIGVSLLKVLEKFKATEE